MPLVLPTVPIPPTHVNPKCLLIYGAPKVGKTTVLSELDGCLIIDLQKGTDYIASLKVQVNNITEFKEVLIMTRHPGAPKYKYCAIDTADALEAWCEVVATARYKASSVGATFKGDSVLQLPNGAGYLWLRMAWKEYFTMVQQCFEYCIFVCHIRDKMIIPGDKILAKDGSFVPVSLSDVSYRDLDLTGKVKSIACSEADAIGHVYRDAQGKLCINFAGNESVNCGSRCKHLAGKNMVFDWKQIYI